MIYTFKFIEPVRNPSLTDENWKLTERGWECFVNGSIVVHPKNAMRITDINAACTHVARWNNDSGGKWTYIVEELEAV